MNRIGQEGQKIDQEEGRFLCCVMLFEFLTWYLKLGTLLRSKRKLEELSTIIQESRRAAH